MENTHSLLCCLVIDLVPFLSYCFLNVRQCTMQCTSNQGWSLKRCSWFCRGKDVWQHCSSHKTGWRPIQHIFNWTLVKATDNFVFFCILAYNTTLLNILVIVRNISVNICAGLRINECLLTENMYLLWFTSVYVFNNSATKFGTFLWATWYYKSVELKLMYVVSHIAVNVVALRRARLVLG